MSSKVKELLDSINFLGELYETIEIEGENKKTEEQTKISINSDDYTGMDTYGQKNEIYGVNVVLKRDGTRIEFVHDDRKWIPYRIDVKGKTYSGKRAKSYFSRMKPRAQWFKTYTIDLRKIEGEGDFLCPNCGVIISPDDTTNILYKIIKTKTRYDKNRNVVGAVVQCDNCRSKIIIEGFNL